ncbi:unnamed protein product [Moneuplotes crassus]|uniref:Uncharacterized protein n=1 Tax=Euplotes crassus TaxID=5936 RepID=A0AAD2D2C2_EUPCR|nr:unnamed protein product [Moneuplotes crassus]
MKSKRRYEQTLVSKENNINESLKKLLVEEFDLYNRNYASPNMLRYKRYALFQGTFQGLPSFLIKRFKKLQKTRFYSKDLEALELEMFGRKKKKNICDGMNSINVKQIKDCYVDDEVENSYFPMDRNIFTLLIKLTPKIQKNLHLYSITLSKRQLEILFNSVNNLNVLCLNFCKIDTKNIKIWSQRRPRLDQLWIENCWESYETSKTTHIDLESIMVCISKSSLKSTIGLILLEWNYSSKQQLLELSDKYLNSRTLIKYRKTRTTQYRRLTHPKCDCLLF